MIAARMHGDRRGAAGLDALGERLGEGALIVLVKERAEILHELVLGARGGLHPGAPLFVTRGQLHPVGREAVAHQFACAPSPRR